VSEAIKRNGALRGWRPTSHLAGAFQPAERNAPNPGKRAPRALRL